MKLTAFLAFTLALPLAAQFDRTATFPVATVDPPGTAGGRGVVRAGCTPTSMSVAKAGSLAAQELGRWTCLAENMSTSPQFISFVGFALDFIELHPVSPADVADIFATKQGMSRYGKLARAAEIAGVLTGIATPLGGIRLTAQAVAAIFEVTYGAGKLGDFFNRKIPPSSNALAGQWGPVDTVLLQPGQGMQWKVYASKMHGAKEIGPRMLTPVPMPEVRQ